eukprot:9371030-Lingulodinium_polyedra.AAC.1
MAPSSNARNSLKTRRKLCSRDPNLPATTILVGRTVSKGRKGENYASVAPERPQRDPRRTPCLHIWT